MTTIADIINALPEDATHSGYTILHPSYTNDETKPLIEVTTHGHDTARLTLWDRIPDLNADVEPITTGLVTIHGDADDPARMATALDTLITRARAILTNPDSVTNRTKLMNTASRIGDTRDPGGYRTKTSWRP